MSEDIEDIAEISVELANEQAEGHSGPGWINQAALTSMVLAMLLALIALLSGKTANETMVETMRGISDQLAYNLSSLEKETLLNRVNGGLDSSSFSVELAEERIAELESEAQEWANRAREDTEEGWAALHVHETLAIGATILSVSVSLTGMAIAVRRRGLWRAALGFAGVALVIIVAGVYEYLS